MRIFKAKREKMHSLDKVQRQKYWKILIGLAGLFGFIWFIIICMYLFAQDSVELVQEVEAQLNTLYVDENKTIIDPSIKIEQVNELVDKANQLESYRTRFIRKEVHDTVKKYEDLILLNQLLTESVSNNPRALISRDFTNFKTTATKNQVQEIELKRHYVKDDEYKRLLDAAFNEVKVIVENYEQYKQLIEQLPSRFDDVSQLDEWLVALGKIETVQDYALKHGNSTEIEKKLEDKVAIFINGMSNINAQTPFDDKKIEKLFSSKILTKQLSGHELDPRLLVSLTFDDGPNPEFTTQVLDVLNQYQIKGTFFVMGAYVDEYPEIARRIVDEGHIIANHTYNHFDLAKLSDEEVLQQIEWAQESIRDVTGVEAHLFRMPFGSGGKRVVDLAQGLVSIIWNIDTLDWQTHDADLIIEKTLSKLEKQSLILMHDTHQATPDALKILIPELLERGYTFVDPLQVGFDYRFFVHETSE